MPGAHAEQRYWRPPGCPAQLLDGFQAEGCARFPPLRWLSLRPEAVSGAGSSRPCLPKGVGAITPRFKEAAGEGQGRFLSSGVLGRTAPAAPPSRASAPRTSLAPTQRWHSSTQRAQTPFYSPVLLSGRARPAWAEGDLEPGKRIKKEERKKNKGTEEKGTWQAEWGSKIGRVWEC